MLPHVPLRSRGAMDLTVGFSNETSARMSRCLEAFKLWVCEHTEFKWSQIESDVTALAFMLRGYGIFLFEHGYPRYLLVYAITAVQDVYPQTKSHLGLAWQIDKKWQHHEPGACRAVLPAVAVRAAAVVAIIWGWRVWTALLLLGFTGMLHPTEIISLVRRDLIFPADLGGDMDCMFIHLQNPKTHRFARRQHCRVDDQEIIRFVIRYLQVFPWTSGFMPGRQPNFEDSGIVWWNGWGYHAVKRSVESHLDLSVAAAPRFYTSPPKTSLWLPGKADGPGPKP